MEDENVNIKQELERIKNMPYHELAQKVQEEGSQ